MNEQKKYLSVGEVNELIKETIDNNPILNNIVIKGEISNLKKYPNAYYFSLKDEQSRISAVMFNPHSLVKQYQPLDGDEVLVEGSIRVYAKDGRYQIIVRSIDKYGAGLQLIELEKLKKKLLSEGLFDEKRKRAINRYPKIIGVLTGRASAAIKDIEYNLTRRYPLATIYYFPSLVQGDKAPNDIINKLHIAYSYPLDTLIIGRGGGSEEDLSAFNNEDVVRLVGKAPMPVISAVGHEINLTLVDLIADKRASTPTGAAELATRDSLDIHDDLNQLSMSMYDQVKQRVIYYKQQLPSMKKHLIYQIRLPLTQVHQDKKLLANRKNELKQLITNIMALRREMIINYSRQLKALNPYGILNRGYSILTDENDNIIDSIEKTSLAQTVKTRLKDGIIISTIKNRKKQ
jgi:exodeoxyribonuclease VII large subunit